MNGGYSSKPHKLPLQYVKEITNDFSDKQVLGTGAFGVVYEGVQPNGEKVAVKKLLNPRSQKQFENEVDLLMRLEHPNIVRLVGYCYEIENEHFPLNGKYVFAGKTESLLCLEYLPNGSLDKFLSDPDKSSRLDWHTRYKIIEGTCDGLQYLHEQTNGPIIHLDLKPANILLNDALEPKLADFGLSRLLDQQGTVYTMEVSGTLGYMPPEYLQGILGTMSDIFSLGVIILEVVTGERKYPDNIPPLEEFIETELKKWRDTLQKAPGCTLLEIDCLQIRRCIQIGLKCMNPSRAKRPTITKVIKMLQGLEGTDCNVSNEIRSGPRELLDIYPLELIFSLEPDKRIRCLVMLINKTNECVAFHFKVMRARNSYRIQPAGGFLWPRATTHVVVTMEERGEVLPSELQCNDEFLVQSIAVREDRVTSKHIPEHTFYKMSSNVVHKVKLPVIRVPAVQGTSQDNQDALVECLRQDLGYCGGKPVAAVLIYKCSVQWRIFEAMNTSMFDRLIQLMGSALENRNNNETVAYWLSNSSALLLLMERTFKPSASAPQRSLGLFEGIGASLHRSIFGSVVPKNDLPQVIEVCSPALLFKQQLTAYLEKAYKMIRNNLLLEVSAFLLRCIEAPRPIKTTSRRIRTLEAFATTSRGIQTREASVANDLAQQMGHWQSIVKILTNYLTVLKSNYIPSFLIRKMFVQIFACINVQVFNSLLLRRECCSFSNGEYVKAGLAELEQWSIDATEQYAGHSWEELKHTRQTVEFLVIHEKSKKTLEDIKNDLCPVLGIAQIYRISTLYFDDKNNTHSVSSEVISSMRMMMAACSNNGAVLLDDDGLSIPFSVDDIQKCALEFEVTDVDMPPFLREYPCFDFLLHETKDKLDGPALHQS